MKIITIVGARPQFIKAAAISRAFKADFANRVEEIILHTGQHYDNNMSEVFFTDLEIPRPKYNINVQASKHGEQTGRMTEEIEKILLDEKPDGVIVYGDTNSTLAGALAAAKIHIPVVHIEAGLRSYNKSMPEEINRILTDHVSTLLFSPTHTGIRNLKKEGFPQSEEKKHTADSPGVILSGDIMLDNTLFFAQKAQSKSHILKKLNPENKKFILATCHRPVNTDNPVNLENIFNALNHIASQGFLMILPLHPRTKSKLKSDQHTALLKTLEANPNFIMSEPATFLDMIMLEKSADMIITDSGGVQKEAFFLQKPGIILREETEWKEIIESGNAILCGAHKDKINDAFTTFRLNPPTDYPEIFGDGHAANSICNKIYQSLSK